MPTTSGAMIGPYKIDREIGRGGMGVIFLATDARLQRTVALKALPEDVASDPDHLQRFEREARVLASLNHPNVAAIYGLEESGGRRYLALEHIEGETFDRDSNGPESAGRAQIRVPGDSNRLRKFLPQRAIDRVRVVRDGETRGFREQVGGEGRHRTAAPGVGWGERSALGP